MNKLILLTIIALAIFKQGSSLEAERLEEFLPSPRYAVRAVYDGDDKVLILGGRGDTNFSNGQYLDEVIQFSLSTREVQVVGKFPMGIQDGSAELSPNGLGIVYAGGITKSPHAYYSLFSSYVWETSTSLNPNPVGNLPYRHARGCSARDPNTGAVYVVGGTFGLGTRYHNILKYDGSNVEIVGALPYGLAYCASTWYNDSIYIFGGFGGLIQPSHDIFKFTPGLDEAVVMPNKLNSDFSSGAALRDGRYIYLVGGDSSPFMIYDPINESLTHEHVTNLPTMTNFGAIYTNKTNRIYLFGGVTYGAGDTLYDEIYYINL